jgi:Kef-type K+ transport system membrane component KefB
MHILFNVGGMLLMVLLGSLLLPRLLSRFLSWETRGMLLLVVLSLPLVSSLALVE